jgi:hypothetical protein
MRSSVPGMTTGIRFGVGSLAHLLKNRFYLGEITYRGEVHRGEHEPMCEGIRTHLAAMGDGEPAPADRDLIERHVARVIVKPQALEVCLIPTSDAPAQTEDPGLLDSDPHLPPTTTIMLPWTAPSFAAVKGIVHAPCAKSAMRPESRDALLAAIAKVRGWIDDIRVGAIGSFVVDGCIPSDLGTGTSAEIEEERRLLYVAMTRAKDDFHLIVPQRFFTHGQNAQRDRHVYASRTRFIPDGLLGLFERTAWPMAAPGPAVRPTSEGVRVDVGARMRGMWR